MTAGYDGRLNALALDDIEAPAVLALIWKKTRDPALRELVAHAHAASTNPQPRQWLPVVVTKQFGG
jgi:hypothetical protein